jgi:hypothetical protein
MSEQYITLDQYKENTEAVLAGQEHLDPQVLTYCARVTLAALEVAARGDVSESLNALSREVGTVIATHIAAAAGREYHVGVLCEEDAAVAIADLTEAVEELVVDTEFKDIVESLNLE